MSKIKQGMPTWLGLRERARWEWLIEKGVDKKHRQDLETRYSLAWRQKGRGGDPGAGQVNSITR